MAIRFALKFIKHGKPGCKSSGFEEHTSICYRSLVAITETKQADLLWTVSNMRISQYSVLLHI